MTGGKTMFEKVWTKHVIEQKAGYPALLYIDMHFVHEGPYQAWDGLRSKHRTVRRPDRTIAVADHFAPTANRDLDAAGPVVQSFIRKLSANTKDFGIKLYDIHDARQGIVHVIGPEQGYTQPGMTIVCGDSHTCTHGAFGAFALGIGASEVEHVLTTQCLIIEKPKSMQVHMTGRVPNGVSAKDLALGWIGACGTNVGIGHVVEFTGEPVRALSMDGRMTLCNMAIEAGSRTGMIAPDQTTFDYLEGRTHVPKGKEFERAVSHWESLSTDPAAKFDKYIELDVSEFAPFVTWGTNPAMVAKITDRVPDPSSFADAGMRKAATRALEYMDLKPGTPMEDISIDHVFIGSCTNSRIEDLRAAANVVKGRKTNSNVVAIVVPGSTHVKRMAEAEGIDKVFRDAGFQWRESGCSFCPGAGDDFLMPKSRCASTSNRNFEGRQGAGARTHLVSPEMAAAAAIAGRFADIRSW